MIEFFKNLFRKKTKENIIETYIYDTDIRVIINRDIGAIRIETPKDKPLSQEQIIEICEKFY